MTAKDQFYFTTQLPSAESANQLWTGKQIRSSASDCVDSITSVEATPSGGLVILGETWDYVLPSTSTSLDGLRWEYSLNGEARWIELAAKA